MLSRRQLIKTTLIASVSAAVTPVAEALAQSINACAAHLEDALKGQADKDVQFHVIDNNLLNLHFYFLNVKRRRQGVAPGNPNLPSFMIVRLPQQHISEAGFWAKNWEEKSNNTPSAMLSGFSYLAFRIWPPENNPPKRQQYLELTLENLLDWNKETTFQLITLVDWLGLKQAGAQFQFRRLGDGQNQDENTTLCTDFKNTKHWTTNDLPTEQLDTTEPQSEIFRRYKSIVRKLLDGNAVAESCSFIPVTFFEVPHEVCLVPLIRKQSKDPKKLTHKARFWKNLLSPKSSKKNGTRKYEVWNNTLLYERIAPAEQAAAQQFVFETPSFRIAGLITDVGRDPGCAGGQPGSLKCEPEPGKTEKSQDILPTLLDKMELAYLTQFAKDDANPATGDRTDPEFDIKEANGFFFTGLGVITHLKYATQKNLPRGIDLIEYEHRITEGRDVFIKVARLGYNSKTGQKYKHVIEGTRKITTERRSNTDPPVASFIELKQYCECIEPEIDYTKHIRQDGSAPDWSKQIFIPYTNSNNIQEITKPLLAFSCHYRRYPFRSLKNTDTKRVPISCLTDNLSPQNPCELQKLEWFWVIKERPDKNFKRLPVQDSEVRIEDYVSCHYEATDWEGVTHSASTPFMFIRKSYVVAVPQDNPAYANYIKGSYNTPGRRDPLVERRLTYFNSKTIAFAPAPKPLGSIKITDGAGIPAYSSKTNTLETDYLESYFLIKDVNCKGDPDEIKSYDEKRYVVFPQMLRARVYVDHIRDMAQKKIPSIVEFHNDYIMEGSTDSGTGARYENYGKLILRHTDAYVKGDEELNNNTYVTIKTALQQAKNQLGNLAVPDIVPDAISMDQSGITLPDNLQKTIRDGLATFEEGTKRLKAISPRAILRGQLSEILGGIDLTAILDELLPQENSPQFELTKLANELEKVEQSILDSRVYKDILQKLSDSKVEIDKAINEVNGLLANIKEARTALNNALQKISREIPNSDELDSLIKNLFERYRMRAFEVLLDNEEFEEVERKINDVKTEVEKFRSKELAIIKFECQSKVAELTSHFKNVSAELGLLPSELRTIKEVNGKEAKLEDYFQKQITDLYTSVITDGLGSGRTIPQQIDDLFRTVAEEDDAIKVGSKSIYYKVRQHQNVSEIEWELTEESTGAKPLKNLKAGAAGYVQVRKKIDDFRAFVAGNLQSTSEFHKAAVAQLLTLIDAHEKILTGLQRKIQSFQNDQLALVSKKIREWNDAAEKYRQGPAAVATKDSIRRVQELVLKGNTYVDFLRRADPYFYFQEQQRLSKDIQDIGRRFTPAFAEICVPLKLISACEEGKECADHCPSQSECSPIAIQVLQCFHKYESEREKLLKYIEGPSKTKDQLKAYVEGLNEQVKTPLAKIKDGALKAISCLPDYGRLKEAYQQVQDAKKRLDNLQQYYAESYKKYLALVSSQAETAISRKISEYIEDKEKELRQAIDPDAINALQATIAEARNVYRALTSIKQQDLTYKWSTTNFRDANLGILTFKKGSEPDTKLDVDVRVTTHFSPGKFPPTIARVETLAMNSLSNFGVGFFNVLTVSFSEVRFQAHSGQSPHCDVKIKDVKFDGAFAFVQEFEKWMAGKGLFLNEAPDHLQLGYSLPIPAIQTPAFGFFNLTLNFDIRLYFDNRPMRFGFSFARPDLKFGIAAGIYAGFGFFALVGDPKRGIVEMDAALEAGAWKGISIGPISGEVKLAFGFRYTRTEASVRLEGYICAEGRLSVWIIEVSARIYLGVVSENSYVEGQCTVTYSAKLGFISRSFSGTFHQRIAGAESKNSNAHVSKLIASHRTLSSRLLPNGARSRLMLDEQTLHNLYHEILRDYQNKEVTPETAAVSRSSWKRFARIM